MVRNDIPAIVCEDPEGRAAHIARDRDGVPIGAALFFTPEDLADLGINTAAADSVELRVEDGQVRVIPICRNK
jgi:hypothetical protein